MSTRTFWAGIVVCLLAIVAIGIGIGAANSGHHRPEGAAEHWLSAVSDTTRKGVRADSVKRAEKIGPVAIAAPLVPADTDGKGAFPDLEVGKAIVAADETTARVPYRLHQRALKGSDPLKVGTIALVKQGDVWHVTGLAARNPGEQVPSEGGPAPSSASPSLFVGGVIVGLLVTIGATALVEWATRSSRRAMAAT